MIIDLEREEVITENIRYFESSLPGIAARRFFTDAVRCAQPQPAIFLAGVTCLLQGIEGTLSCALLEAKEKSPVPEDHPMDRGEHSKLNNKTLRNASKLGFNIECLAFPEERGLMADILKEDKIIGIVKFRNEFSHGKTYRATENFGKVLVSNTFLLALHFKELLTLSYAFAKEIEGFRGQAVTRSYPRNPFDY